MVRIVLTNASFLKESGLWENGELEITSRGVHFSGERTEIRKNYSDLNQVTASVENYEKKKLFRKSIEKWLGLSFSDGTMWFFKFEDDHFADSICRQIDLEREKEAHDKRQADIEAQKQTINVEEKSSITNDIPDAIAGHNQEDSPQMPPDKDETNNYEPIARYSKSPNLIEQKTTGYDKSTSADLQTGNDKANDASQKNEKETESDIYKTEFGIQSQEDSSVAQNHDSPMIPLDEKSLASTVKTDDCKTIFEVNEESHDENKGTDSHSNEIVIGIENDGGQNTETFLNSVSSEQDESDIQEEWQLQDESNINFRKKFVLECIGFARACTEYIPENRTKKKNIQSESYLFDLMNVCYSKMEKTFEMYPMPTYIAPGGKLVKCREDGIYADKLITAYEPFLNNATEHQNEVIRRSLNDSVGRRSSAFSSMQLLCLMPDVVDDFSRFFRNQLEINGQRPFQIPRSIALAYAVQQQLLAAGMSMPEEFLCLDYDGEEFMAIKIRCEMDKSGVPIFVRMGRFPIQGEHPSYKTLALSYLTEYKQKYQVPFTKKMTHDLVDTKILQHLLLSKVNRPILITDGETSIDIWIDNEIVKRLHEEILNDANAISRNESIPVYALCSFGWHQFSNIWNVESLENGCKGIKKRFEEGKTLWEEYLPSLQLGVHQDGTFADLDLISERDRRQQIASAFLGKTVEIIINNGTIVLTQGKEYYDLPLVREVYGTMNKEKLARFKPESVFDEDKEVELRIYYTYGDVDSYRLVSYCQDGTKIESEWVDTGLLANNPPHYVPEKMSPMNSSEAMEVYNGFSSFVKRIKAPYAFATDTLYNYRRDETKPYSRYLRELNRSGFPFRSIRNYFDADNQTAEISNQINHMLDNGTFDCIADVLNGALPTGHDLEKGTSTTFPNLDQGDVLRDNLSRICCEFGMLYTINHPSVSKLVKALKSRKSVQFWAPITAYITRDNDDNGVWEMFSKSLKTMKPTRPKETIFDLRAISNVCYLTKDWIFELYHGPNGDKDIEWIIKNIIAIFDYEEWRKMDEYNARRIRDILELLLCICLLKSENPDILNCNDDRTKEIVKKVKKIDSDMRELNASGKLKQPFNSRIHDVKIPNEFYKVNKIIYCLVQTLTGGESVNLVGFRDD